MQDWGKAYQIASYQSGLRSLGLELGEADLSTCVEAFKRSVLSGFRAYDDVEPVLTVLAQSFRLGIVTNGAGDLQRAKLEAMGIGRFFEVIVASTDADVGKPHPRVFTLALEGLSVEASHALMIGDSVSRDIDGARAAGIDAIWLDRGDEAWPLSDAEVTPRVRRRPPAYAP